MTSRYYYYNNEEYEIKATAEQHCKLQNDLQFLSCVGVEESEGEVLVVGEEVVEDVKENISQNEKQSSVWNQATVNLLINSYRELKEEFRNPKTKKKALWSQIKTNFEKLGYSMSEDLLDRK
uniref:Uncharacterized protein LOC114346662 n=1 Tax=Diabrotica virgifera virgifera TaxID=50390 RepID=A0A6P7HBL9_DIAVI